MDTFLGRFLANFGEICFFKLAFNVVFKADFQRASHYFTLPSQLTFIAGASIRIMNILVAIFYVYDLYRTLWFRVRNDGYLCVV